MRKLRRARRAAFDLFGPVAHIRRRKKLTAAPRRHHEVGAELFLIGSQYRSILKVLEFVNKLVLSL